MPVYAPLTCAIRSIPRKSAITSRRRTTAPISAAWAKARIRNARSRFRPTTWKSTTGAIFISSIEPTRACTFLHLRVPRAKQRIFEDSRNFRGRWPRRSSMTLRSIPALLFMAGAVLAGQSGHEHYRWQNGWNSVEIELSGHIGFTDDDSDIKNVSSDGFFELEQRAYGGTKTFEVTPPRRVYSVNGSPKPFDADAKAWLAQVLPKYIRESAINAPERVQRILHQRGAAAVLDDIAKIESDGPRRTYLHELIRTGNLKPEDLREAMRQARKISSDGEKAAFLTDVAPYFRTPATLEDYFYAVDTISSDGEKAALLMEAARNTLNDEARQNFFRAMDSISSDGERRQVLSTMVRGGGQDRATLDRVLRSAAMISSDGEKSAILVDAAAYYKEDPALRRAFFDAVGTISSDGEHRVVLDA